MIQSKRQQEQNMEKMDQMNTEIKQHMHGLRRQTKYHGLEAMERMEMV